MSNDVEQIRDATDLVALIGEYVRLEPKGREHVGLCPFHDDSRPSMRVITHLNSHFFKCHACGEGGDCYAFLMKHLNWTFPQALEHLSERTGIALERRGNSASREDRDRSQRRRTWLRSALEQADAWFRKTLTEPRGAQARACIEQRGISRAMVERFGLGAAPEGWQNLHEALVRDDMPVEVLLAAGLLKRRDDREAARCYDAFRNRLIFPIHDEAGLSVAFGGRDLGEDGPKYLNSGEHDLFRKGRLLYAMHLARGPMRERGRAIVAEGYTDVIACHQAGWEETVGTLGTAFTDDHARALLRQVPEVVLLFDGDEAGRKAADRAVGITLRHVLDVKICVLPEGTDPADLLADEAGTGQFRTALDGAIDALDWCLDRSGIEHTAPGSAARQQCLERLLGELSSAGIDRVDALRRDMLVARIAELTGVPVSSVLRSLQPRRGPQDSAHSEPIEDDATGIERELLAVALAALANNCGAAGVFDHVKSPHLSSVAEAALDLMKRDRPVDIPHLHDALDEEVHRRLATDLVESGHAILESHAQVGEDADTAIERLTETLKRRRQVHGVNERITAWRTDGSDDADAAARLIEELRATGRRATAIPRSTGG